MLDQVDGVFIVEFAVGAFAFVALYAIIANVIAYLAMRKRMNDAVRESMKRFLFKAPLLVTMIGFTAGLTGYFLLIIMDTLLHANKYVKASDVNLKRKEFLVLFTLAGILYGTLNGLAFFYKRCKAMNSSTSRKE